MKTTTKLSLVAALALLIVAPANASHFPAPLTPIDAIDAQFGAGGGAYNGTLVSTTWDWFTFFAQAGDSIQLNVDASGASPMGDPGLSLYGVIPNRPAQAGDITEDLVTLTLPLDQNDDFNGFFPQINFNVLNDGWYAAAIGGWGGSAGTYTATLTTVPEPGAGLMLLLGWLGMVFMNRRKQF